MTKKIVLYTKGLRYELELTPDKEYMLASNEKAQLFLPYQEEALILKLNGEEVFYQLGEEVGTVTQGMSLSGLTFFLIEAPVEIYDTLDKQELVFGSHVGSTFYTPDSPCHLLLKKEDKAWKLNLLSGQIYLNNALLRQDLAFLQAGDELSFDDKNFKIYPDEVAVSGQVEVDTSLAQRSTSRYGFYEEYPDFHRSPRIIYRGSEDKVSINTPSTEPNKPTDELLKLVIPPLLMVGVTILIALIQPRGIYILLTMVMSLASMFFSATSFFKNRKKYKQDLKERKELYRIYLKDKAIELNKMARDQKQGQLYHYPELKTLSRLTKEYSHRIYEKTPLHFDFLYYRLGLGKMPTSYQLSYSQTERSGQKDPLEEEGYALYDSHREIDGMPVVANLSNGPVGYIGPRPLVIEQLQLMVTQLAVFHSYHDVQFITIMPEEERAQWEWMRWLPHSSLQDMNVRGFVYNQRTHDQVLNSLNQILKLRKAQLEDKSNNESTIFSPHYVVLITDEKLILDHVIMEFFTEDPTELGCSLIFVQDVLSSLSENIQTIINIKDRNSGQLVMEEGVLAEHDFALDHFPADYDKEEIARRLAPLNHLQNLKSSIPDVVTFMEMYEAESFADLHVPERWARNAPYKSLSVPVGLRGKEDLVNLNLHEKAHGPHGLVAGTTGSGKSEMIQSYILSLAVNFHPYDVAFLLIDYKGGGMANLFKDLPHLLGTITNLDGAQSMRALVSINAELKRRQRLFAENEVNHINQYQKKYKNGEVTEPMPHLFLISDEFAELKANQPDFMKELVSTARIGRSLGIHLILATQKPSGVVDDQIWSNSRFKVALKVADRSDSAEMLRTPDAAEITQVGRAYLQVGNNEVYELFQSAWSGADYQPDKDDQGIEDQTIYLINDIGQYEVLNEDLSGLEQAESIREVPTELEAIVDNIQQLTQEMKIADLPQPWLPPLPERMTLEGIRPVAYEEAWQQADRPVEILLGMADIPQAQKQEPVSIDLTKDGNVLLYGSPGYGKTTFLQSAAMDLARNYAPDQVVLYLLDFGTNGLAPLGSLPHVADLMLLDQGEKIAKFVRILEQELARRKKLLSDYGVGTMSLYRQASGQSEPTIVILLDSFEAMKDEAFEPELFKLLMRVSREGLSIGVHLLVTAGRQSNLRATLYSNFKHQLTLKQNDSGEVRTIVGSTPLANTMEDIQGRALMKRDEVDVVQLALPVDGDNDIQVVEKLRLEALALSDAWQGDRPRGIPMVPEELEREAFYNLPEVEEAYAAGDLPLGLDMETVHAVSWKVDKGNLLYLTDKESQMTTFVDQIARVQQKVIVLAPRYHNLQESEQYELVSDPDEQAEYVQVLSDKVAERLRDRASDHVVTLVLYDLPSFIDSLPYDVQEQLAFVQDKGPRVGYASVVIATTGISRTSDSVSRIAKTYKQVLMGVRMSDQVIVTNVLNKPIREGALEEQVHYYIEDNHSVKIKVLME